MNHHLSLTEKIRLLKDTTSLDDTDVEQLAEILDCCPFDVLKAISEAIEVMSRGTIWTGS